MAVMYKSKVKVKQTQTVTKHFHYSQFQEVASSLSSAIFSEKQPKPKQEIKEETTRVYMVLGISPVGIPSMEGADKIASILQFSLKQQKEFDVNNNPGFVVQILHRCFNAINIKSSIVSGYRRVSKHTLPHMWLKVSDCYVDNAIVNELYKPDMEYLPDNYSSCYRECDFLSESSKSDHSNDETLLLKKSRMAFFLKSPDKALALSLNQEQMYNYYFAMIRYMYDSFKVTIVGINPSIRYVCWWCGSFPKSGMAFISDVVGAQEVDKSVPSPERTTWKFPACSQCAVASYCSPACQTSDWLENHGLNCISRGTVYLPPLTDPNP